LLSSGFRIRKSEALAGDCVESVPLSEAGGIDVHAGREGTEREIVCEKFGMVRLRRYISDGSFCAFCNEQQ
jgi:hypothetical protein